MRSHGREGQVPRPPQLLVSVNTALGHLQVCKCNYYNTTQLKKTKVIDKRIWGDSDYIKRGKVLMVSEPSKKGDILLRGCSKASPNV